MMVEVLQGTLVLADRLAPNGQVVVDNGRIVEVVADGSTSGHTATHNYGDGYILPGLIDVHVHGIAGADIMDGTPESMDVMLRGFAAHGVTGILASTVTQSIEVTKRAISAILEAIEHPREGRTRILGIHLEGPFLSHEYRGMQNENFLLEPDEGVLRELLAHGRGHVVRVSLAPELPGADRLIRLLREEGIYVSIAHTGATYEEAVEAMHLGATHVTHCFNAMTGLHHRKPGVAGAAMLCDDLYTELVADGIHVHPAVMRLLARVKGRERVMLVTDAMRSAGMPDGEYEFGGQRVFVKDRIARLADGRLASSTLTMEGAVRTMVQRCGASVVDAAYMGSTTPAEALGLGDRKGRIAEGYDADLAVLDAELRPIATWIEGKQAFPIAG